MQQLGDSWQMCTHTAYAAVIERAMETKKAAPLSAAAMEVLTIVAYNQPVSKGFVEHVRGVDSSSVVNTLVEKELLMEAGRLDVPGKPIAYATTPPAAWQCSRRTAAAAGVGCAAGNRRRDRRNGHTHGVAQRRRDSDGRSWLGCIPALVAGTAAVTAGVCLRL